jgi:phosphoserine phosphatase
LGYRLIFFDLDGTLITCRSSWQLIHQRFGTLDQAKKSLEEYRSGKISYQEFMVKDTSSWLNKRGRIRLKEIEEILSKYRFKSGVKDVILNLREKGLSVIIVTAGLNLLAEKVGKELGADVVLSNRLRVDSQNFLAGGGLDIVDPLKKDMLLKKVSEERRVPLRETVAVGDTVYDLTMLQAAGLGLYFGKVRDIKHSNIKPIRNFYEILDFIK